MLIYFDMTEWMNRKNNDISALEKRKLKSQKEQEMRNVHVLL